MADLTPGSSGADIVQTVVAKIGGSGIFPSDNQFLRRVAYVESKDGTDPNTYRSGYNGGIWQVDKVGFEDTQNTSSHPALSKKFDSIERQFGIKWREVTWEDLRKPLYSGLAARLFLSSKPAAIPPASDVEGQAAYWKKYYNTGAGKGSEQKFVDDVKALEG